MLKASLGVPEAFSSFIKRPLKPPVHGVGNGMWGGGGNGHGTTWRIEMIQ